MLDDKPKLCYWCLNEAVVGFQACLKHKDEFIQEYKSLMYEANRLENYLKPRVK